MDLLQLNKILIKGIINLLKPLKVTFMMSFMLPFSILPPLKAKKGETYAENIHGKYDELQDAVASKNTSNITELIKVNRIILIRLPKF